MSNYESLLTEVEKDLSVEQFEATLPRLLDLTSSDPTGRTHILCVGVRCYFAGGKPEVWQGLLDEAHLVSETGGVEAKARVALTEASLLMTTDQFLASEERLALVFPVLNELPIPMQALTLAIHGRNEAVTGAYAEAITHSQEAISIGPQNAASSAFANMTIALTFQIMGRFHESEPYALEQIKIYNERGSKQNIAASFSVLAGAAAAQNLWEKALAYQKQAADAIGDIPLNSGNRPIMLTWMANSELELGNHAQGLEYAEEALAIAEKSHNSARILNYKVTVGYARCLNGLYQEALEILTEVFKQVDSLGDNGRIELYQHLAETYKALDRREEAFDICYRLWELQRDFDERTREALLRYHKSLEKKIHFQEMTLLKTKSDSLERELSLQTMSIAAQMDLLATFRDDLRVVVRNVNDPGTALQQVKEKLKALPCEQIDWSKFEAQFTSVHPEFRKTIAQKFPDLTLQELRVCQLLRVGMKSFEVGRLLCISERGVENHRFNIRKKLGLKTEQSLGDFLAALN